MGSPSLSNSMEGTVESGARSEKVEVALEFLEGRVLGGAGDEGTTPVEDVGTGVGYISCPWSKEEGETRRRFGARGRDGEDERGSKAGNSEGAGRFAPATGAIGSPLLVEEELIVSGTGPIGPGSGLGSRAVSRSRVEGLEGFMFIKWYWNQSINSRWFMPNRVDKRYVWGGCTVCKFKLINWESESEGGSAC